MGAALNIHQLDVNQTGLALRRLSNYFDGSLSSCTDFSRRLHLLEDFSGKLERDVYMVRCGQRGGFWRFHGCRRRLLLVAHRNAEDALPLSSSEHPPVGCQPNGARSSSPLELFRWIVVFMHRLFQTVAPARRFQRQVGARRLYGAMWPTRRLLEVPWMPPPFATGPAQKRRRCTSSEQLSVRANRSGNQRWETMSYSRRLRSVWFLR